jgi:hypothetical protein
MADYRNCIQALAQAAGRQLSDEEAAAIFERVHKAALDIKAGRPEPEDLLVQQDKRLGTLASDLKSQGRLFSGDDMIRRAAERAATELEHEAEVNERNAQLQVVKLAARTNDVETMVKSGMKPLDAVERTIVRDYSGRSNVESLEQRVAGYKSYFSRQLMDTWDALGKDFLKFWQDRDKLHDLVKELRGEDSGDPLAKKGAAAFHKTAEEARQVFNQSGGDIGRLDDWGMPQHHSQFKVSSAGRDAWVDKTLPMLNRDRYVDDAGLAWDEPRLRDFLGKAWDTIATDGHANTEPGEFKGSGKAANRHGESRQIHFKDAESVINYWNEFGEKTAVEILSGHVETMAKDIAFIEHFGPNPNVTFQTLRDAALKKSVLENPVKTPEFEGRAANLDSLYRYSAGQATTIHNLNMAKVADGIAHLNTASKLGGAALASFFGDKPMMEAVSHLNNIPMVQRWRTELSLLNPANTADRRLLQEQGLMLETVRSGLNRFSEGLGSTTATGKTANAVMRITGMNAINDIRKGAFGISLMSRIGHELGSDFANLPESDVRALRNYGITEADWKIWKLADLDSLKGVDNILSPEVISRIPDDKLKAAGFTADDRRNAIVKLLGAINTESEFAIVTPGWKERAQFYSGAASQRGTFAGEFVRSFLQFKSFPWAFFQRSMDAVANSEGPAGKAMMSAFLVTSTTLGGAMLMQTREMLAGRDPLSMVDDNWYKFWAGALLSGGALGVYGDFLYAATHTRYGSGILETMAGPTIGPLLQLGVTNPLQLAADKIEGKKDSHFLAKEAQSARGFLPGSNIWYAKAAFDHLIMQNVMEAMSPGFLRSIRRRTEKEWHQDWYWDPGEATPARGPDLGAAFR